MMLPYLLVLLVCIGVYIDAKKIGIKRGQISGFFDAGAGTWAIGCFLFLIIFLPAYLFKRGEYIRINAQRKTEALSLQQDQEQASSGQV